MCVCMCVCMCMCVCACVCVRVCVRVCADGGGHGEAWPRLGKAPTPTIAYAGPELGAVSPNHRVPVTKGAGRGSPSSIVASAVVAMAGRSVAAPAKLS